MRRDFKLPQEDRKFLDACGFKWETILNGNEQWLLLHDFPIPGGYNVEKATAAVLIVAGYPDSPLDMIYFKPSLARLDNRPIPNLTPRIIDNQDFQQWSRHRTGENPWQPGDDCISTHLSLANHYLKNELTRN
jgi:hypothetical protein